jgi:putative flippase GtrA
MTPFVRFNIVGVLGFLVQVSTRLTLTGVGVPIPLAICLAVEAALVHNFVWHECWTWAGMTSGTCAGRLARFHVSNGVISILGNITMTAALVNAGAPLVIANIVAVLICALLNFIAAHLFVFCAKTWPTLHGHLQ